MRLKLAFLASHNGTDMRSIIEEIERGKLDAEAKVVISNNGKSPALQFAKEHKIPKFHISEFTHEDPDRAISTKLKQYKVDLVILSGYMKKIGNRTLDAYRGRILNVHPALLPKYGGKGMYGDRVHQAVLASGDKFSGPTIHIVNEEYDRGKILAQTKVPVEENETVESLRRKIQEEEKKLYIRVIKDIITGRVRIRNKE